MRGWSGEPDQPPPSPDATAATDGAGPVRRVLLLTHTGREEARSVAREVAAALAGHGIVVRLLAARGRSTSR